MVATLFAKLCEDNASFMVSVELVLALTIIVLGT